MNNAGDFVVENDTLIKYLGNDPKVVIPKGITTIKGEAFYKNGFVAVVVIPDSVIHIGSQAFDGCTRLKEIRIPKTVKYIDPSAFRLCSHVESIVVAEGNPHYYSSNNCLISQTGALIRGCKNSVIPDDGRVVSIGNEAFSGIDDLKKIFVPDCVTFLGVGIFWGCSQLKEVRLPNGLKAIPGSSFSGCNKLTKINIPTTVQEIGGKAFLGCKSLREIVLPGSLRFIGYMAFEDCSGLNTVVIPNEVETIEANAFAHCKGVRSVTLGCSVKNIGESAFSFCTSLRKILVTPENPYISAMGNCVMRNSDRMIILGCCGSELHPKLGAVGVCSKAFSGCNEFTDFVLTDSIKKIEKDAFYCCDDSVEFVINSMEQQYSRSVYEVLFEATKADCYLKIVTMYSIAKYASAQVVQDPAIFSKLKASRKGLVQRAINRKELPVVKKLFDLFPKISQIEATGYLQLCDNVPEIRNFLQAYVDSFSQKTAATTATPSAAELKALFSFKDIEGGLLVTGYKGAEPEITIPAIVGKKRVLGIGSSHNSNVTWDVPAITISNGIEFIDEDAFKCNRKIQTVVIPDSVREIKQTAFFSCTHLTSIAIPRGAVVGWGAFAARLHFGSGDAYCLSEF